MPLSTRRSPPHALRRAGLFGTNGLNGGPFIVGEFTPHDSNLQLGRLNHDPAACLNSERVYPSEATSSGRQRRWRRSAIGGTRENLCSLRALLTLTQLGHRI